MASAHPHLMVREISEIQAQKILDYAKYFDIIINQVDDGKSIDFTIYDAALQKVTPLRLDYKLGVQRLFSEIESRIMDFLPKSSKEVPATLMLKHLDRRLGEILNQYQAMKQARMIKINAT